MRPFVVGQAGDESVRPLELGLGLALLVAQGGAVQHRGGQVHQVHAAH
jgi:hypothetical protein